MKIDVYLHMQTMLPVKKFKNISDDGCKIIMVRKSTPRKRTHTSEGATFANEELPIKKICSDFDESAIKPMEHDDGHAVLQDTPNMDIDSPSACITMSKVKRQLDPPARKCGRAPKPKTPKNKTSTTKASTSTGKRRGRPPKPKPIDIDSDSEPKCNSTTKPICRKRKISLSLSFDDNSDNDDNRTEDDGADKPFTNATAPQEQGNEAPAPSQSTITPRRESFDNHIDVDECDKDTSDSDSDSDLVPFSPSKSDISRPVIAKGDLVWVKVKKVPFWPAVVKNVYKKGKRISLAFIGYEKPERYRVNYNKQKVIPYFDVKEEQFNEFKEEALKSHWGSDFENCLNLVEDFVRRRGLGEETRSTLEFFYTDMEESDPSSDEGRELTPERQPSESRLAESGDSEEEGETEEKAAESTPTLSQKALISQSIRTKSGQKLVDFIKTDTRVKDRLMNIKQGKIESQLHQEFSAPEVKKRSKILAGIGPLQEHQVEDVVMFLMEMYPKPPNKSMVCDMNTDIMSYIQSVWYPEAVVFALTKMRGLSYSKAWERFYQGDKQTKEELEVESQILVESAKNIEPEVQARYQLRLDDMERKALGKIL
ncbi:unnamed protein product [Owenia fusiformis]|uniref:PWWP domain-containing protein n=1 Tax=Owenia fusiformis TaxID=6347 RepID=A0A8S4PRD4_OWEFU|nr:unnamed protein product [Owenia fusiformis]